MRDKPTNLQELLYAALRSQVEIGLGEVIVDRSRLQTVLPTAPAAMPAVENPACVNRITSVHTLDAAPADPPGDPSDTTPPPKYSSLEDHFKAINECRNCPLAESRTKFVYGTGNPNAELMFIGEAPGRDEDLKGEPFVGAAGQLLDKILAAMKLQRTDVYIANILKCRPPNNRDPLPEEVTECLPHLKEQIRIIRPKVICCLGRIAAQNLLNTKTPLGRLRKQWHRFEGIPLLVTYHPAALLRYPVYKKDTWEDMQLVMAKLADLRN